jgi:hypothetical protein
VLAAGFLHGQAQGVARAPACARAADGIFFADGDRGQRRGLRERAVPREVPPDLWPGRKGSNLQAGGFDSRNLGSRRKFFWCFSEQFLADPTAVVRAWSRVRSVARALCGSRGGSCADPAAAAEPPPTWDIGEAGVVLPARYRRQRRAGRRALRCALSSMALDSTDSRPTRRGP